MSSFSTRSAGPGSAIAGASTSANGNAIPEQIFTSTLSLAVSIAAGDVTLPVSEYNVCYLNVRRNSYLPMILRQVREQLVDLVVSAHEVKDEEIWFDYAGVPLRWHWPIGLLYDYSTCNLAPTAHPSNAHLQPPRSGLPSSPTGGEYFGASGLLSPRSAATSTNHGHTTLFHPPPPPLPWPITVHIKNPPPASKLSPPTVLGPPSSKSADTLATYLESIKQAYMASLKEADFIRNGNTKKVNALRKVEQDGIWDAVVSGDWSAFSTLVGKVLPPSSSYQQAQTQTQTQSHTPSRPPSTLHTHSQDSVDSTATASTTTTVPNRVSSLYTLGPGAASSASLAPSTADESQGEQTTDTTNSSGTATSASLLLSKGAGGLPGLKTIPVRFVLQGGTIVQESVPPLISGTTQTTLGFTLHALFPALFPAATTQPQTPSFSLGLDFSSPAGEGPTTQTTPTVDPSQALAIPIMQGVRVPLFSTMLWLNRCLAGADGWVTIVLLLLPTGDVV